MVHVHNVYAILVDLMTSTLDDIQRSNQGNWVFSVSPESCMLTYEFVQIMNICDFLGTMEVILRNIWMDFNLNQFHFWSTFHMNWHK